MMWKLIVACAVCIATTHSLSLQLPADIAVTGGKAVDHVCGACCQAGAYCGAAAEDLRVQDANGRELVVTKGSSLTCVLRDRGAFGAVDGGLCVPSDLPTDFVLADMCRLHDKTLPASHTLTEVVYQAGLVAQESCGACYDGHHFCGANLVCRRTEATATLERAPAICVPENAGNYACEQQLSAAEPLQHESCDKPTPAAEIFEQQHSLPFRRLQAVSDSLSQTSTVSRDSARSLLATSDATSTGASTSTDATTPPVASSGGVTLTKTLTTPAASAPKASTALNTATGSKASTPSASAAKTPSSGPAKPPSKGPAKGPTKAPAKAPTKAPVPAPAPAKAPVPAPAPAMAFAPVSGGGNVHLCSKSIHCPLSQYNMCKKGKCVKKPNYCDKQRVCKAGYKCQKHWCVKTKQSSKPIAKHG